MIDLGSRRFLGYSMAEHMRTELVTDALTMAIDLRGRDVTGVIFHSDRGSQYLSHDYRGDWPPTASDSPSAGPACAGTTRPRRRCGHH